jgi:hypothetical protein
MALVTKNFSDIITFTRASTATFFNSAGVLTSAAVNAPRFDYNPSTLAAQGLLIEESRTNSIRNNTMVGAVAGVIGSGGAAPTNWSLDFPGLTRQIVGTGTSNGITWIDLRFSGTTTNTYGSLNLEGANIVSASNGQSWAHSAWVSVVGGSTANINSISLSANQYTITPTYLSTLTGTNIVSSVSATFSRFASTLTTNNASVAYVQPVVAFAWANGAAIDITLRIGLPQLEQGAFATSVIPTTTTALTRAADVASVNTLSPWFNATEGTLYTESQQLAAQTAALFPRIVAVDDGSTNNAILHLWRTDTSRLYANAVSSGSGQYDLGANGVTQTNVNKMASAFAANNFAASINGGSVLTDLAGVVPSGLTTLRIGRSSGTDYLNGYLRRITYYPRRLANADLQAITT